MRWYVEDKYYSVFFIEGISKGQFFFKVGDLRGDVECLFFIIFEKEFFSMKYCFLYMKYSLLKLKEEILFFI